MLQDYIYALKKAIETKDEGAKKARKDVMK